MGKRDLLVVDGDITLVHDAVIIHQVNCQGVMGAGVAKSLYEKWPQVRSEYLDLFERSHLRPSAVFGRVQTVVCDDNVVCNAFSQFNYGNSRRTGTCYTDADALERAVRVVCEQFYDRRICVPARIGCGLTGGNWSEISERLSQYPVCAVRFVDGVVPCLPSRSELNRHVEELNAFRDIVGDSLSAPSLGKIGGQFSDLSL